jgi:hypothetical protein
VEVDEAWAVAGSVSLLRRVSGRPGAEGAPFEGRAAVTLACWRVVRLVVALGLPLGGAMRRDCWVVSWGFGLNLFLGWIGVVWVGDCGGDCGWDWRDGLMVLLLVLVLVWL